MSEKIFSQYPSVKEHKPKVYTPEGEQAFLQDSYEWRGFLFASL
jgi:hypothetical protein